MCGSRGGSENLLAGLGKSHPGKGRGEGFRVHLAARALQVIILPRLSVRRLKHQPTSSTSSNLSVLRPLRSAGWPCNESQTVPQGRNRLLVARKLLNKNLLSSFSYHGRWLKKRQLCCDRYTAELGAILIEKKKTI